MTEEIITLEKADEKKPPTPPNHQWVGAGIILSLLCIIIVVCVFGYGYFQLARVNVSLAGMVTDVKSQLTTVQNDMANLKTSMTALQEATKRSQDLSAKQEAMVAEWRAAEKGDLDKWHLAEAQYLIKLANYQAQYIQNFSLASVLLQQADAALQNIQNPNVLQLRQTVANDLTTLRAQPSIDVTQLYLQLSAINQAIDQLPIRINLLKPEKSTAALVPQDSMASWWKRGWDRTLQALGQIVIVKNIGEQATPLVLPDEKSFLYQNLHAEMASAIWGLLYRNNTVYQTSLSHLKTWIQQYFAEDSTLTRSLLTQIETLQKVNIEPQPIHFAATLALFDENPLKNDHDQENQTPTQGLQKG